MRPLTAAVATGVPTLSSLLAVSAGVPWQAAFALAVLGLVTATILAVYVEYHRHAEYRITVDKASDHAALDVNAALHLLRGHVSTRRL